MQPHEASRARPLLYGLFNLSGFAAITVRGWHVGMDLRNYRGVERRNLVSDLTLDSRNRDFLSDYAGNAERFDAWIDAPDVVLGSATDKHAAVPLMLDGNLGLPPRWPLLAPEAVASGTVIHEDRSR